MKELTKTLRYCAVRAPNYSKQMLEAADALEQQASRIAELEAHNAELLNEIKKLRAKLAAAILKATGPLEEEIERLNDLPVRYYQPNNKGCIHAVYGSSSINFVEELRAQLQAAQNLLACIHGDGGHHQDKVGFVQGCTDAESKYYQLVGELDAVKYQFASCEQRVAEWQPIETASKDGSWVLGWRQYATRPRLIQFDTDYEEWINEDGEHVYSITHWMPLPKAPANTASS